MIFDVANPPLVPNANLDADTSRTQTYVTQDGGVRSIAPGDFVTVDPCGLMPDPLLKVLFQVCNTYANYIGVLVFNGVNYRETALSPGYIINAFRRAQRS